MAENLNLTDEALVSIRWIQKEMGLKNTGQAVGLAIQVAEILIKRDCLKKKEDGGFVVITTPRVSDDRWYDFMRDFFRTRRGWF